MKKNIAFVVISLFLLVSLKAQYIIEFSDAGTFSTTCGKVTPSQWTAKDVCEMELPPMVLESTDSVVSYTFSINVSGNLESNDVFNIMYKVGASGTWMIDSTILGDAGSSVRTIQNSMIISTVDTLYFKFQAVSNSSNEFWAIKNGDVVVNNVKHLSFSLPIELLSFDAVYNEDFSTVDITWATLTELNNDYFTVERSYNGIDFEGIAIIDGAGNSNSVLNYEFTDFEKPEQLTYYRLRQTDFDGKTTISAPVAVNANSNNSTPLISGIGSNNGQLMVSVFIPEFQNITIEVIDVSGRVLVYDHRSLDEGSHLMTYDLVELESNIVFVRISNEFSDTANKKVFLD